MRFAGNFHPEWGYLAPAPSFMRTARVALVATAVGATAGAGVVFALVDRPEETSVAARTLVRPVEAAAARAQTPSQPQLAVQALTDARAETPIASVSAAPAPANIATLAEPAAASDDAPARPAAELRATPVAAAVHKKAKPRQNVSRDTLRDGSRDGPVAILPGEYHPGGFSRWADRDAGWGGYDPDSYRYR